MFGLNESIFMYLPPTPTSTNITMLCFIILLNVLNHVKIETLNPHDILNCKGISPTPVITDDTFSYEPPAEYG